MKRLLVLGSSGQVARALVAQGPAAGWDVTALGRAHIDLAKPDAIAAAIAASKPDALANAAAYTAVDKAESEPDAAAFLNGEMPGRAAAAAAAANIPFVHLSSDYVFGGQERIPYREADPTEPLSVYGRTKRAGEIAAYKAAGKAGGRCVILRTSWVFAPWGANFVRTMLRLAKTQERLRVVDDQQGGPTSAIDIADAVLAILARQLAGEHKSGLGLFHFQGRPPTTWARFAEAILDEGAAHGHPRPPVERIATHEYKLPAARPAWGVLDCARIAREYDITPPDWRKRLAATVSTILADGV
jgi:dTDP-4-dehydrorhamnose reductase